MAQSVAHILGKDEVAGSIPAISTKGVEMNNRKKREEALQRMVEESEKLGLYDDNTGVQKNEYYDIISTEDCFDVEDPDPDKRSWYYDNYGVKRKK